jgi:hypothetical protein
MHKRLKDSQMIRMLINIETSTHKERTTISARSTMPRETPIVNLDVWKNPIKNLRIPDLITLKMLNLRLQILERRDVHD